MYTVDNVADYFLSKESMSPKKLQKLVYYGYAWTIALLNDTAEDIHFKLFESDIEAWVHGPVVPELYQKYKDFGWHDIPKVENFDESIWLLLHLFLIRRCSFIITSRHIANEGIC